MNFRPGSLPRLFVCHFPEGRVLCLLTNDRVLHDRIAELVNDCSDGEYATKSFIQARVGHLLEPPLVCLYGYRSPPPWTAAVHASSNECAAPTHLTRRRCGRNRLGTIPVACPTRVDENHDIGLALHREPSVIVVRG
jgi:hypothetical protein